MQFLGNGTRVTCRFTEREWLNYSSPAKAKKCSFFESPNKSIVSSVLWGDKYWLGGIFDLPRYSIKFVQVNTLFLSLTAMNSLLDHQKNPLCLSCCGAANIGSGGSSAYPATIKFVKVSTLFLRLTAMKILNIRRDGY